MLRQRSHELHAPHKCTRTRTRAHTSSLTLGSFLTLQHTLARMHERTHTSEDHQPTHISIYHHGTHISMGGCKHKSQAQESSDASTRVKHTPGGKPSLVSAPFRSISVFRVPARAFMHACVCVCARTWVRCAQVWGGSGTPVGCLYALALLFVFFCQPRLFCRLLCLLLRLLACAHRHTHTHDNTNACTHTHTLSCCIIT